MNEEQMQRIAALSAKAAVKETFVALGVDMSTDKAIISMQGDFRFLRTLRFNAQKFRTAALCSLGALMASGVGWAVWYAVKGAGAAE